MNSKETLKLSGKVNITVTGKDGIVKDTREIKNLVVQGGLRWITASMAKTTNSPSAMTHIGIGNSSQAVDNLDTDLIATSPNKLRVALTSTTVNSSPDADKSNIIYEATFQTTDNFSGVTTSAITEAGIFNAASGGTMLCRTVFPVVNKGTSDTVTIKWTITLDAV